MDSIKKFVNGKDFKSYAVKYAIILLGTAIAAVGFQFFLAPNAMTPGGTTGVAQIINLICGLPVGLLSILINVPLFLIAWKKFGLDFIIGSLVGMLSFSAFIDLAATFDVVVTHDAMLAAIIGGMIVGIGVGLVFLVGATTGGIDIIARLLRRKFPYVNIGTLMLIVDGLIVIGYAITFHVAESALYSLICMFAIGRAVDLVVYGMDNSCIVYIISDSNDEITEEITNGVLHRGATLLHAEGAYTHEGRNVLMCVIKRHQIVEVKRLVRQIDPKTFLIVTDANNVFGNGFDSIIESD